MLGTEIDIKDPREVGDTLCVYAEEVAHMLQLLYMLSNAIFSIRTQDAYMEPIYALQGAMERLADGVHRDMMELGNKLYDAAGWNAA